jgi:hypothetical protein
LRDRDVLIGLLLSRPDVFDLLHHVHTFNNFSEYNVLVVEERSRHGCDEELAAVSIWSRVLKIISLSAGLQ